MGAKIIQQTEIACSIAKQIMEEIKEFELSGETHDSKTPLTHTKNMLMNCISSFRDGNNFMAVEYGKLACEDMLRRADRAFANGGYELDIYLRKSGSALARPISILLKAKESGAFDDSRVDEKLCESEKIREETKGSNENIG